MYWVDTSVSYGPESEFPNTSRAYVSQSKDPTNPRNELEALWVNNVIAKIHFQIFDFFFEIYCFKTFLFVRRERYEGGHRGEGGPKKCQNYWAIMTYEQKKIF